MQVKYEVKGSVAQITLDRPEAMNAMNPEMYQLIDESLLKLDGDPAVRVGIITGAGDQAFTAGADLKRMHTEEEREQPWQPWRPHRWEFGLSISKPLIAAVNGYALAGGLELALMCDIRLASATAQFGTPEVKWNILHGYGALRLPQMMSLSDAFLMLLTGQFISADEALRMGLVSRVVPPLELIPAAYSIADAISQNGPLAVRMTKELVYRGLDMSLEDALRIYSAYYQIIGQTADQREGTTAFAQKRKPKFTDS
ncbi:enoyl-CoA hydratase/isomerase family protein [bacterium]|nr:MAG: enoyl-CoA hydratase/isomerase family protein [bacterium]